MEGFIDHVSPDRRKITGWIKSPNNQEPTLKIRICDEILGQATLSLAAGNLLKVRGEDARSFSILTERSIGITDILAGNVHVIAVPEEPGRPVAPSSGLLKREQKTFANYFASLPDTTQTAFTDALGVKLPRYSGKPDAAQDLSYVTFPVGLEDPDGTVRLGREGYFFAVGGANKIETRYKQPETDIEKLVLDKEIVGWEELINNRTSNCEARGITFRQFIVPDKITALPQFAPFEVTGPTSTLTALTNKVEGNPNYLDFLPIFRNWQNTLHPWRKADVHPAPVSMYEMTAAILKSLGYSEDLIKETKFTRRSYHEGDLGRRFFRIPIWDENIEPDALPGTNPGDIRLEKLREQFSETAVINRRVGVYMKHTNPCPLIDKKVMLFGTSTSNFGLHPNQLSWWMKQLFSEYHFVWQTDIEYDLIDKEQPDIVLSQSVERYLSRTPAM
ncbi:hypothetical protein ACTXJG_17745 [Glutamicibacter arilaitensis]|uniref:hypothetical protein n=1 Tax=Glutamicibacter TaxID=1742989 RepID=UPI003FD3D974